MKDSCSRKAYDHDKLDFEDFASLNSFFVVDISFERKVNILPNVPQVTNRF